jgi:hypothetical protein
VTGEEGLAALDVAEQMLEIIAKTWSPR